MKEASLDGAIENMVSTERTATDHLAQGLVVPVANYTIFHPGSFLITGDRAGSQSHDNLLESRNAMSDIPKCKYLARPREIIVERTGFSLPPKLAHQTSRFPFLKIHAVEKANVSDSEGSSYLVTLPIFSPIKTLSSIYSSNNNSPKNEQADNHSIQNRPAEIFQVESPGIEKQSNGFLIPSERNNLAPQGQNKSIRLASSTFTPDFRIDSEAESIHQSKGRNPLQESAPNPDNSKSTNRVDTNIDLAEMLLKEDRYQSFVTSKHQKEIRLEEGATRSHEEPNKSRSKPPTRKPTGFPPILNFSSGSY